jgi:succinate-acetate transporter protein
MSLPRNLLPRILVVWIGTGIVRILLGSSTSAVAYFFFGLFWLISAVLVLAAVRQLATSRMGEEKVEALAICAALAALFVEGLFGGGEAIVAAALVFAAAAIVLLFIYGRRLRRAHPANS